MTTELTITIKDEEGKKLTRPYLIYETFTLDETDPIIDKCLKELLEEFEGEPDDIRIKAVKVIK